MEHIRHREIVMRLGRFGASGQNEMNGPMEWFAALGAIIAAALIAADLGRRSTGIGFVVFVVVSVAWIASGLSNGTMPLIAQNAILLLINAWGVWQYLLNPRKKKEIERAEQIEQQAKEEVA